MLQTESRLPSLVHVESGFENVVTIFRERLTDIGNNGCQITSQKGRMAILQSSVAHVRSVIVLLQSTTSKLLCFVPQTTCRRSFGQDFKQRQWVFVLVLSQSETAQSCKKHMPMSSKNLSCWS